jgi:uncharacterized LabA/DUF88 family protein
MKTSNGDSGYKVDFEKLFKYIDNRFKPEGITYFGALFVGDYFKKHNLINNDYLDIKELEKYLINSSEERNKEKIKKQIRFIKKLEDFGFITKIKPLKIMPDGKKKSDCDVNIVVEGMDNLTKFDRLILLSGDGDFMPFLRILKRKRKKIQVFSFNRGTAREIKKFIGGNWHNLEENDYRKQLRKNKMKKAPTI